MLKKNANFIIWEKYWSKKIEIGIKFNFFSSYQKNFFEKEFHQLFNIPTSLKA